MKAVVAAFNQEKALVGAFSVIMNLRMELGCNFLKHYPPAAGVQPVRLPHSLRREVVEVVLHQLGQVVAEVDLELGVELA